VRDEVVLMMATIRLSIVQSTVSAIRPFPVPRGCV
jgi:hypothetical protein